MRFALPVIVNVLAPGAGLILLGRFWTGLVLALLFGVCGELAICGALISPGGVPAWITAAAGALAAGAWLLGQWMLRDRIATLRDPALQQELAVLRNQAAEAVARGDLAEARGLLRIALEIDPDDVDTLVTWARLMTLLGRFDQSHKAWQRVACSGDERYRREAVEAIEKLPT